MKYWTHLAEWQVPVAECWEPMFPIGLHLAGDIPPETRIRLCALDPTRRHKHTFGPSEPYHRFPRPDLGLLDPSPADGQPTMVSEDGYLRLEIEETDDVSVDLVNSKLRLCYRLWDRAYPGNPVEMTGRFSNADSVYGGPSESAPADTSYSGDTGSFETESQSESGKYGLSVDDAKERYVEGESSILTLEDELETVMVEEADDLEAEEEDDDMMDDDDRNYHCNVCDKDFSNLGSFKTHWERFHE